MNKVIPPVEEQLKVVDGKDELAKIKAELANVIAERDTLKANNTKLTETNAQLYLRVTEQDKAPDKPQGNGQPKAKTLADIIKNF